MNPQSLEEARRLSFAIEQGLLATNRNRVETVICPPFVFLPAVAYSLHFAKLGAQDVASLPQGPFTGEVSGGQLQEFAVQYVIIGHSERRSLGEDDKFINKKIRMATLTKLQPILCVGFGAKKSSSVAAIKRIVKKQLQQDLAEVSLKRVKLTIAYEPVWAISRGLGTGKAVKPSHAAEIIKFIKTQVPAARVIYGGSLDAKNAASFAAQKIIEGGLVGGASLVALEFLKIIKAFTI